MYVLSLQPRRQLGRVLLSRNPPLRGVLQAARPPPNHGFPTALAEVPAGRGCLRHSSVWAGRTGKGGTARVHAIAQDWQQTRGLLWWQVIWPINLIPIGNRRRDDGGHLRDPNHTSKRFTVGYAGIETQNIINRILEFKHLGHCCVCQELRSVVLSKETMIMTPY